jgi:hypothetical protein
MSARRELGGVHWRLTDVLSCILQGASPFSMIPSGVLVRHLLDPSRSIMPATDIATMRRRRLLRTVRDLEREADDTLVAR